MLHMPRGRKASTDESNPGPDGSRNLLEPRDAEEAEAFEQRQALKEAALAKKTPANERYADKQALAEKDQKAAANA
jgi:hypothetical protein